MIAAPRMSLVGSVSSNRSISQQNSASLSALDPPEEPQAAMKAREAATKMKGRRWIVILPQFNGRDLIIWC
jgi:hypothetical protein